MAKYTKKPVTIDAVQWTGDNYDHVCEVLEISAGQIHPGDETLVIPTLEGLMTVSKGDFVIKGVAGELYPCKPEIFALTYDGS